jgi:hypothetical protein
MTTGVRSAWIGGGSKSYIAKMETERMMARLLAEIRNKQAKADANLREMRAGQELLKEEMLAKMETYQERMEVHHERVMAKMDSRIETMGTCLEKTEATEEIRVRIGASGSP